MANPYYPPKSLRSSPGYQNPLAIPYSMDYSYRPSSSNVYPADPYGQDGHHHQPSRPLADEDRGLPYYDPYTNASQTQLDPVSIGLSTENLVENRRTSQNDEGRYVPGTRGHSPDDDHALPVPVQPFARGYGGAPGGVHERAQHLERPESPFDGVYLDRAPVWEKMNAEQREIAQQFPKDLDDEGGGKTGFQAAMGMLKNWKQAFKFRYLHWWILTILAAVLVALITIYNKQIVDWLTPISKKANSVPWGWTIPVAILFVISFPPLFGHEIVLLLVGVVYGMWLGFGIASLGTLLGEIGNFYAFKFCLQGTAAKYERKNIYYACMAEMVREGGFWVMFLARLSAVPGHFTTAIFATVGMNIWIFTLAAILALPKQLIIVYFGVAIEQSGDGGESTAAKVVKYVVLAITIIITVWTGHWLYKRMEKVRPEVQRKLRQRRYNLLTEARDPDYAVGFRETAIVFQPSENHEGGDPDAKDGYELHRRRSNRSERKFKAQLAYDGAANEEARYYGVDAAYGPAQGIPSVPQGTMRSPYPLDRQPSSFAASRPLAPGPAPIQFHRPLRQHSHDPAPPSTPPIGSGNCHEESDLSQVRAELMQSPTGLSNERMSAVVPTGRPQIRVNTELGAQTRYRYASEVGSVYMLGSEASTDRPSQHATPSQPPLFHDRATTGGFQPGQIVSSSSMAPPPWEQNGRAPVPALQVSHGSHFPTRAEHEAERRPLRDDSGHLSPISPVFNTSANRSGASADTVQPSSSSPAPDSASDALIRPSTAQYTASPISTYATDLEGEFPPAYASNPHLSALLASPQERVSQEVARYQLSDEPARFS